MFKKIFFITLIILSFSLFGLCLANPTIDKSKQIQYKDDTRQINLEGVALYLQPNNFNDFNHDIDYLYHWGFELKYDYALTSESAIYVRWLNYRNNANNLKNPILNMNNEGSSTLSYGYTSNFDLVFLELSQQLNIAKLFFIIHGGVEYIKIKTQIHTSSVSNTTQTSEETLMGLNYNSAGGIIGLNVKYQIRPNIQLFITNDIGMLIHGAEFSKKRRTVDRTGAAPVTTNFDVLGQINGSTANLYTEAGIAYQDHTPSSDVNFKLGWLAFVNNIPSAEWSGAFLGIQYLGKI